MAHALGRPAGRPIDGGGCGRHRVRERACRRHPALRRRRLHSHHRHLGRRAPGGRSPGDTGSDRGRHGLRVGGDDRRPRFRLSHRRSLAPVLPGSCDRRRHGARLIIRWSSGWRRPDAPRTLGWRPTGGVGGVATVRGEHRHPLCGHASRPVDRGTRAVRLGVHRPGTNVGGRPEHLPTINSLG